MKKYGWDKLEFKEVNTFSYNEDAEENPENLIDELFDSIN
jgi:hypothetical protein